MPFNPGNVKKLNALGGKRPQATGIVLIPKNGDRKLRTSDGSVTNHGGNTKYGLYPNVGMSYLFQNRNLTGSMFGKEKLKIIFNNLEQYIISNNANGPAPGFVTNSLPLEVFNAPPNDPIQFSGDNKLLSDIPAYIIWITSGAPNPLIGAYVFIAKAYKNITLTIRQGSASLVKNAADFSPPTPTSSMFVFLTGADLATAGFSMPAPPITNLPLSAPITITIQV